MGWRDKVKAVDETYAEKAVENAGKSGGIKWLNTKTEGIYKLRVLPPGEDGKFAFKQAKIWNLPNPDPRDDRATVTFVSVELTWPELRRECPILKVIREYAQKGIDVSLWEPQVESYFNVVIRSAPYYEGFDGPVSADGVGNKVVINPPGVYLLRHTEYSLVWFNDKRRQREEYGDILDPVDGRDWKITRVRKGKKVDYSRELTDRCRLFATDEEIDHVMDQRINFSQLFKFPDDEQLEKIFKCAQMLESQLKMKLAQMSATYPGGIPSSPPSGQVMPQRPEPIAGVIAPSLPPNSKYGPNNIIISNDEHYQLVNNQWVEYHPVVVAPPPPSAPKTETAPPPPVVQKPTAAPAPPPPTVVAPAAGSPSFPTQTDDGKKIIWASPHHIECYGDSTVYHKDADQKKKCMMCPYEFECSDTIEKLKTGAFTLKRKPN